MPVWSAVIVVAALLSAAPTAHASFRANEQELESLLGGAPAGQMPAGPGGPSGGDLGQPSPPGSFGTTKSTRGISPGGAPSSKPPTARTARRPTGKTTRRCYRVGQRRWVCRFSRGGVLWQRCHYTGKTRPTRRVGSCTPATSRSASVRATPSAQGWVSPALPQVGKLFQFEDGRWTAACTGTAVSATLVLTAGHCVYDRANGRYFGPVFFAPGAGYAPSAGRTKMTFPYGLWRAQRMWTTTGWQQNGAQGADWGLIEIGPEEGSYLGARVGTFAVYTNLPWPLGSQVYAVGYPASGVWRSPGYAEGRDQYECDAGYAGFRALDGGYGLYLPCSMNGGSSGGPWLRFYNGQWVIAGINNLCSPAGADTCSPYSTWLISSLFNNNFSAFWNGVIAQLNAT
jgi:hypothetical protein